MVELLSSLLRRPTPVLVIALVVSTSAQSPRFEVVQPELFAASGAQPNAWADFDSDGDLDLFVGFRQDEANRLYRNDEGTFVDVAAEAGVADVTDTRAASWGDFDGDGDPDLFVGFTRRSNAPARLYPEQRRGQAVHGCRRRHGRRGRRRDPPAVVRGLRRRRRPRPVRRRA